MAGIDISVILSVLGGTELNNALDAAGDAAEAAAAKVEKLGERSETIRNVGAAGFAVAAGAIGLSVARYAEFEEVFVGITNNMNEASFSTMTLAEGTDALQEKLLELRAGGDSFEELTAGFDLFRKAGQDGETAMKNLTIATELADAAASDVATTTRAMTQVMTAFRNETIDGQQSALILFATAQNAAVPLNEFADAFTKVANSADLSNVTFRESAAAFAALSNSGLKPAGKAIKEIDALIRSVTLTQKDMPKQSKAVQDAWNVQNVSAKGLAGALAELDAAFGGDKNKMAEFLKDKGAGSAAIELLGEQKQAFADLRVLYADDAKMMEMYAAALDRVGGSIGETLEGLEGSMDVLAVTFGEVFAPTFLDLVGVVQGVISSLNDMDENLVNIIAGALMFTAGLSALLIVIGLVGQGIAFIVPVIAAIGAFFISLAGAGALAITPLLLIVAAIAALGAGIYLVVTNFDAVLEFFGDLPQNAGKAIAGLGDAWNEFFANFPGMVDGFFADVGAGFNRGWDRMVQGAQAAKDNVLNWFDQLFQPLEDLANSIRDFFVNAFTDIGDMARDVFTNIDNWVKDLLANVGLAERRVSGMSENGGGFKTNRGYAGGGAVNGPGTATSDSILARLSDGEFVMRAAAVEKVGVGFLDAINSGAVDLEDLLMGNLPQFADGGIMTMGAYDRAGMGLGNLSGGGGNGSTNRLEVEIPGVGVIEGDQTDAQARGTRMAAFRSKRRRPHAPPSWER